MNLKRLLLVFFAVLFSSALQAEDIPVGVNLKKVTIREVMDLYESLIGRSAIIASNTPNEVSIRGNFPSSQDAAKGIKNILLQQYGIIVSDLDAKSVSVTYNDNLPRSNMKDNAGEIPNEKKQKRVRSLPQSNTK